MSTNATQFRSKIGLIAATVGSAVGLGNIWRFPAVAQENGGSAFLLVYVVCVLLLGIPVMVAEFALGRAGRTDVIGAFARVTPRRRPWAAVGVLSVLTSALIAVFYLVVTGWTVEYLWQSLSGDLFNGVSHTGSDVGYFHAKMHDYIQTDRLPMIFTVVAATMNMGVLLAGVGKGIERLSNVLMPLLFVLLGVFCVVSLTLPGASEGLEFFFKPDFSKVTASTWLAGLGQAFFSLSLGMGILVTYAAYYPARTRLVRTAIIVATCSVLVAIMMGVVIFPAVTSFGLMDHGIAGTTLVFVTLPEVFTYLPASSLWSSMFFLLLAIAALTSTVSITEVATRCLQDRLGWTRRRAVWSLMLPLIVLSGICSLSFSSLDWLTLGGLNMFNFLDYLTADFMLPIASLGLCLYVGWVAPRKLLLHEMTNNGKFRSLLYKPVLLIIRYLAPVLIALVLISPFI